MHTKQFTLIDDSYNASPTSVKAALETLQGFSNEPVVVLGDMAELGADEIQLHTQIGRLAGQITPHFYTYGKLAKHYQGQHFDSQQQLAQHIIKKSYKCRCFNKRL